jgi:hypothetical protein
MTPAMVLIAAAGGALVAVAVGIILRRRSSTDAQASRRSHGFSAVAMPLLAAVAVANAVVDADSRVFLLIVAAIMATTAVVVLRNTAKHRSDLPEG